jgi:hypothetical protein
LHWLADSDAQQIRAILSKHTGIYLHGHLHKNDVRYDDSGNGLFLSIQSGAAFQGRAEDDPQLVSGIVWANLDTENGVVELQPQHWSVSHREWKISSDAFANQRKVEGTDWWRFPLPGSAPVVIAAAQPSSEVPIKTAKPAEAVSVRSGWALVDRSFLAARSLDDTPREHLLQFFDGRPPNWRLALSALVPRRAIVDRVVSRFNSIEDANKPTIVNLLGAGGEGENPPHFFKSPPA